MRVCFLVPDGTGLRNYLYSKIIDQFSPNDEIVVWTTLSEEIVDQVTNLHGRPIGYVKMDVVKESFLCKLLKESITYARLRFNTTLDDNPTTMINWTRKKYTGFTLIFFVLAALLGRLTMGRYERILFLEKLYEKVLRKSDIVSINKVLLREMDPDVIFCTHQRSIEASAIVLAANGLDIPTIGAVYSWDNLPKARLLVHSQKYVVWSDYMRSEMNRYYPEISNDHIVVTGTPQFEFYLDREFYYTKSAFCSRLGLSTEKKIICFSGNDLTFPCDDLYLEDLADALLKMPEAERPQILLRRCPVDLSGRFNRIVVKYPDLIKVADPIWRKYTGGWDAIVPTHEDVILLVNISLHSDVVINVGSTMAHDFAVFNKPAIYINYDQPSVVGWSARVNNQYQQFKTMPDDKCVIWLNSKDDIERIVKLALEKPEMVAVSRQTWFRKVVKHPLDAASDNIAKLCRNEVTMRRERLLKIASVVV